jgi:hypothetical protein
VLRPGDEVLLRYIPMGRVFWALPGTIVEHDDARVGLWIAPGTPFKRPEQLRVPIPQFAAGMWEPTDHTWFGGGILLLHERGAAHSIWPRWDEDWRFGGWYVNLESPWRESKFGFDSRDHVLDLVVRPDRTWSWKDEEELDEAVEHGVFTTDQAQAIRQEGERVIEHIEAWSAPFDEGWENWRPDPAWPLPQIPAGWANLGD